MDRFGKTSARWVTFIVLAYLACFSLFDYRKNWVQPELPQFLVPEALKTGTAFQAKDLLRCFDYNSFDLNPQPRFLSHFFLILNSKFRLWVFQWFTPHPTFSITWLLTLLFSPLAFYVFLSRYLRDRSTALLGVAMYLVSTGFLSAINMNFLPAKPLTNLGILIVLAFGASARTRLQNGELDRRGWAYFALMLVSAVGCLFCDVTGAFAWVAIVFLFPDLFYARRFHRPRTALVIAAVALQAFSLFYLLPKVVAHLGYGAFNFWKYAVTTNGDLRMSFGVFFSQLFVKTDSLTKAHLIPPVVAPVQFLLVCVVPLALAYCYHRLGRELKSVFWRALALLFLFVVFEVVILSRHPSWFYSPRVTGFYYGAPFSIFYVVLAALMVHALRSQPRVQLSLVVYYVVVLLTNHERINQDWIAMHRAHNSALQLQLLGKSANAPSVDGPATYEMVKAIWEHRGRPLQAGLPVPSPFAKDAPWIWREASLARKP